ncbi:family 16 glycosylhydrolase [Vibrio sp. 10N.261.51.F12]|uniref:family 16 glycosylhydrolase n=1 Tax=Vibrio sp. 10N.261.51.F12 TaxID=3229679 RepID=UPI00354CCFF8
MLKESLLMLSAGFTTLSHASTSFTDPLAELDPQRWFLADGWENGFPFLNRWQQTQVEFNNSGLAIHLENREDEHGYLDILSGEIRTLGFYGNGCFQIEMKPVKGDGVISSFFLFAGPYDQPEDGNGVHNEIDIEFIGANTNMVQFNFWTNDDNYQQKNEHIHYLDFDASEEFHTYAIEWNHRAIRWYIDGSVVYNVRHSERLPIPMTSDTKLRAMMNVWATDPSISNWAGEYKADIGIKHSAYYRNFKYSKSRCNK